MAAFAEFDTDGSGYLEVGELLRAIRRIDPNLTDQEVRARAHAVCMQCACSVCTNPASALLCIIQHDPAFVPIVQPPSPPGTSVTLTPPSISTQAQPSDFSLTLTHHAK